MALDDFIANLLSALETVAAVLNGISFRINASSLKLFDLVAYCVIVGLVLGLIKDMSYNGVYTLKKSARNTISRAVDNFKNRGRSE